MTKKELSTVSEPTICAVCERTMLKGERPEPFLVRDGGRRRVCELCVRRAEQAGWIRESAQPDMPATQPRTERRGSLLGRMKRRAAQVADVGGGAVDNGPPAQDPAAAAELAAEERVDETVPTGGQGTYEYEPATGPRDPRHVRAVPTNADVKIAHALDLFNQTEHARTVAGLCRTLGAPWVSALPIVDAPSEVSIVVAWELSWYQYRVDLSDVVEAAILVARGEEMDDLDESLRQWNASALTDGTLAPGASPGA